MSNELPSSLHLSLVSSYASLLYQLLCSYFVLPFNFPSVPQALIDMKHVDAVTVEEAMLKYSGLLIMCPLC